LPQFDIAPEIKIIYNTRVFIVRWKKAGQFFITFIISFIAYIGTACPTLYTGDSGELSAAAFTVGIAHPPGYPLLVLLGRAFSLLSFGNIAFMLNILSALLAAAFAGVMALLIQALFFRDDYNIKTALIAIAGGLLTCFSNALWSAAVGFEVYSLGILLISLIFLLLINGERKNDFRYMILAAYIFGLSLANHLSAVALVPLLAYYILKFRPGRRKFSIMLLSFLGALTLYLYLPVRSAQNPLFDWNHPANLSSFIEHVTAVRYQTYVTGFGFENFFQNLQRSLVILQDQFPLFLLIFGFVGLVLPGHMKRSLRLILLSAVILNIFLSALYDIPDIDQYYLPSVMILTVGLVSLLINISSRLINSRRYIVAAVAVLFLTLGTFIYNYDSNDQSDNRLAYIYGEDILKSTPRDSYLISVGDNSNSSVYYLRYVENKRTDLEIYDSVISIERLRRRVSPLDIPDNLSGPELCMLLARFYPDKTYLVKEHMLARGNPFNYNSMNIYPRGMVYGFGQREPDPGLWDELIIPEFDNFSRNLDFKGMTMLTNLHLCRGEDLYRARKSREAVEQYRLARNIAESTREASVHNSLGIFFRHEGWPVLARNEYESALNSRHLTADEKANVYVNLGNLEKDRRKYGEAIKFYKDALDIDNNHAEARYNLYLAEAYGDLSDRKYRSAAENFEKALSSPEPDPMLNYNLGVIYDRNLNDKEKAVYYYKKFIELFPNSPQAEAVNKRLQELQSEK